MMQDLPTTIAFLGAGNIATPYAESMARHPEIALTGVFDLDATKCTDFAKANNCRAYASLDEMISDGPEIIVNLTSAVHHFATTKSLLEKGMNVFSEKPLALSHEQAQELVDLSERKGARLACAPSLWLGTNIMDGARRVVAGAVGDVKLINAEVNQGRIELWHPAPQLFFQVGPVTDAGVYPLALLTAMFGPIRSVSATAIVLSPERRTKAGEPFPVPVPDAAIVAARFASGPLLRLSCNFYVGAKTVPRHIEFHGETGSLRMGDWLLPGTGYDFAEVGNPYEQESTPEDLPVDWALGVADLAASIKTGRAHLTAAAHGAHIAEVLEAIAKSARMEQTVSVHSDFAKPDLS